MTVKPRKCPVGHSMERGSSGSFRSFRSKDLPSQTSILARNRQTQFHSQRLQQGLALRALVDCPNRKSRRLLRASAAPSTRVLRSPPYTFCFSFHGSISIPSHGTSKRERLRRLGVRAFCSRIARGLGSTLRPLHSQQNKCVGPHSCFACEPGS